MQRIKDEQLQLLRWITDIRADHPTIGMRDLYFMIKPQLIGRDAFENFCKSYDLMSKKDKNYRSTTDSTGVIRFPNLMADITLTGINQVWQSDITYYELKGRFYYLTFILDSFSRRIIGHSVSSRLLTNQTTIPALKKALKTRSNMPIKDLIFHSDGGGQYYASEFLKLTRKLKIRNSMCEYAWENGKAERVNGVIKNNYLKHRTIENFDQLQREVDRSVLLYNRDKPHLELKRRSPITFENDLVDLQRQAKLKMTESFDAMTQIFRASSPKKSGQAKLQNQDVFSAMNLEK